MESFVGSAESPEKVQFTTARTVFERILVATDFSTASAPAIAQAMAVARTFHAHLWIAHAYNPARLADGFLSKEDYEASDRRLRRDVESKLHPLVEVARRDEIDAEALVLTGDPTEAIVSAARQIGADLIVMGTHGRRGMARLFLGSVASQVIAIAPCPVLTVRGKA